MDNAKYLGKFILQASGNGIKYELLDLKENPPGRAGRMKRRWDFDNGT